MLAEKKPTRWEHRGGGRWMLYIGEEPKLSDIAGMYNAFAPSMLAIGWGTMLGRCPCCGYGCGYYPIAGHPQYGLGLFGGLLGSLR